MGSSTALQQLSLTSRALFLLLCARLVFHAFYVPAYEGPDEPFHLGRAATVADAPWREGWVATRLPPEVVSSIRAHPCGPDLARAFGCRPFRGDGAFDALASDPTDPSAPAGPPVVNYEAHQPPLFYIAVAPVLKAVSSPASRLLAMRLASVLLVIGALVFPIRKFAHGRVLASVFLFMLLPGAAEALARGSNDAAVFLWSAIVTERMVRPGGPGRIGPVVWMAVGPLLKLTAFPVVTVAVVALWLRRERRIAAWSGIASLTVFAVQALRGWSWGGTYELNRLTHAAAPGHALSIGLARAAYTFAKTIFWLGEWSFFRAPVALVACWFLLVLTLTVRLIPWRHVMRASLIPPSAHCAGLAVASAGLLVMAILNQRLFGEWGGLGGWYAWGWAPWLFVAARPALGGGRIWMGALAGFVLLSNALWFASAASIYGF